MHRIALLVTVGCAAPLAESPDPTELTAPVTEPAATEAPPYTAPPTTPSTSAGHLVCASDPTTGWPISHDWLTVDLTSGAAEHWRGPLFARYLDRPPVEEERLWAGLASVRHELDGVAATLPVAHIDVPDLAGFGSAVLYGEVPTTMVCWHDSLSDRLGLEPLPDAPSTLDEGCPEPLNVVPLPFLRATGIGRCGRFDATLNGDDLSYPVLGDADLRGADLTEASLFFASLLDAQLEGADLRGFEFGYAEITGRIDEATRLPTESCEVEGGEELSCFR